MSEFLEDYGEFIALFIIIEPAIRLFVLIGRMVGEINFLGG
jgi:hypothetical protein